MLIGDRMLSDHQIIGIYITLTEFPCGRRYWKFNHSLLDNNLFLTRGCIFNCIFFKHNIGTAYPLIVWDTFKCGVRGHAIQYSCHALTLVIFVFFINLVRSGCDEGGMYVSLF